MKDFQAHCEMVYISLICNYHDCIVFVEQLSVRLLSRLLHKPLYVIWQPTYNAVLDVGVTLYVVYDILMYKGTYIRMYWLTIYCDFIVLDLWVYVAWLLCIVEDVYM